MRKSLTVAVGKRMSWVIALAFGQRLERLIELAHFTEIDMLARVP